MEVWLRSQTTTSTSCNPWTKKPAAFKRLQLWLWDHTQTHTLENKDKLFLTCKISEGSLWYRAPWKRVACCLSVIATIHISGRDKCEESSCYLTQFSPYNAHTSKVKKLMCTPLRELPKDTKLLSGDTDLNPVCNSQVFPKATLVYLMHSPCCWPHLPTLGLLSLSQGLPTQLRWHLEQLCSRRHGTEPQ